MQHSCSLHIRGVEICFISKREGFIVRVLGRAAGPRLGRRNRRAIVKVNLEIVKTDAKAISNGASSMRQHDDRIAVSVCCLSYNHAEYIRNALDSFLSQKVNFTYEIVVRDDASTDGTKAILEEYEAQFPGLVRVIYEEENQYSKVGKLSVDVFTPYAKGEYIAFCEGDDFWIDDSKLQRQFDYLEAHSDYSMCFHNALVYDCRKGVLFRSSPESDDGDRSIQDLILHGGGYANCTGSFFYLR